MKLENYDKFPEKQIYLSSELSNQVNQLFLSRKREKYAYLADKRIKVLWAKENLSEEKLNKAIIVSSSGMLQWGSIEKWLQLET